MMAFPREDDLAPRRGREAARRADYFAGAIQFLAFLKTHGHASLGEIAQIQQVKGQMREAEQSYREALGLQREIGDQAGISTSLVNLAALINEDLGRPDDALPLLREALQVRRDVGNTNGEALVLNNIGSVYDGKGQYSEAQTYFERALELREKTKVPREIADTLHNLAETLSKEGLWLELKYESAAYFGG